MSFCCCCREQKLAPFLKVASAVCLWQDVDSARSSTATFEADEHRFILVSDGRLAIDYSSYGNLCDQVNLHDCGLSRPFLD